mgnify:CR=1 FL=1
MKESVKIRKAFIYARTSVDDEDDRGGKESIEVQIEACRKLCSDNGWEVVPEALLPLLRECASLGKPILVTENGLADAADARRAGFLEEHVAVLAEAEGEGLPVAGYLHWSLVDNYEWLDGWAPRFGLLELDRATLERRRRPSAAVFRRLAGEYLGRSARGGTPDLTAP